MKLISPVFSLLIVLSFSVFAQQNLTLADAVLKQRSELAPKNLKQLKWIPETKRYSHIVENALISTTAIDGKELKLLNLESLNAALKKANLDEAKRFPSYRWLSSQEFMFSHNGENLSYDLNDKKIAKIGAKVEGAAHQDFEPNQRSFAFTVGNNLKIASSNGEVIDVTNESNEEIVNGQASHRSEFGIRKGTFWSTKGNYLAYYHNDQSDVTDYPLVSIKEKPAGLKSIKYPMAGMKSEKVSLKVFDLKTKKNITIQTDSKFEYLTNIAWSEDEKYVFIATLNRGQNHMKLNKYETQTGKFVSTLFEEKDNKYVEPQHPLFFVSNDQFVWWSQRDGFMHLYLYNGNGMLIRQLTKGKWLVKKVLGLSDDKSSIFIEGTGENPTETHIYVVDISTAKVKRISKKAGVHSGQLSSKGNYLIDSYSSISIPRNISLIDQQGKEIRSLLKANNPLENHNVSLPELLTLKAEDDMSLYARLIKPSHFDPTKKYPALVYVYNGPHVQLVQNRWLAAAPLWMYYMAEKGYVIFTIDGRGSAGRGLEFEQSIFRNLGDQEVKDQLDGVEYLKSLPYIDGNRLAVHGWSYGGFMTTSLMLKAPGTFKVGVAGGPVIDWRLYEVMYTERYMDTPEENPDGFKKANLLNYVENLKGDLLMIHGLMDDVVVPQHNLQFVRACVEKGVQIDFFPYPAHPHNVRGKDRVHLMQKVLSYIENKL